MDVASAREYFENTVPALVQERAETLSEIDAVYEFQITGSAGGTWTLDMKVKPASIAEASCDTADCTVIMEDQAFVQMINGEISPQLAFLNGKLKVTGNMGLALKLTNLFT